MAAAEAVAFGAVPGLLDGSAGLSSLLAAAESPDQLFEKETAASCETVVKQLFDLAHKLKPVDFSPLQELLVDGFTLDQIWEEVQLYNEPACMYLEKRLSRMVKKPETVELSGATSSEEEEEEEEEEVDVAGENSEDDPYAKFRSGNDDDGGDASGSDEDAESAAANIRKRLRAQEAEALKGERKNRKKRHGMENSFFSLDAMDAFIEEAEQEYMAEYDKEEDENGEKELGWSYEEGDKDDSHPYEEVRQPTQFMYAFAARLGPIPRRMRSH